MRQRAKIVFLAVLGGLAIGAITSVIVGDSFTTSFTDEELPNDANVNRFDLGKVSSPVDVNNIAAPSDHESKVMFTLETEDGQKSNILIRRVKYSRARHEALKVMKHLANEHRKFKEEKTKDLFSKHHEAILTAFYVQRPGDDEWTEVHTIHDPIDDYRFEPNFGVRVYPNGLLLFHFPKVKRGYVLVNAGTKTVPQLIRGERHIEIGGGKTVDLKDEIKAVGRGHVFDE